MTQNSGTDPNKTLPSDHRESSDESLGVGDAIPKRRSEPRETTETTLPSDIDPPGTDPEGERTAD